MQEKSIVTVNLWSGLRAFTDGQQAVDVEAQTVGEVLDGLVAAYPGLEGVVDSGVSVAVDGKVIASSLTTPVAPENEIWLMQRLKGG